MIGGLMLLCAVGAMLLIATWSLAQDDLPDSRSRDGLLALRDWTTRKPTAEEARRAARQRKPSARNRRPADRQRKRSEEPRITEKPVFEDEDMDAIAREAEDTLPAFVKAARETY